MIVDRTYKMMGKKSGLPFGPTKSNIWCCYKVKRLIEIPGYRPDIWYNLLTTFVAACSLWHDWVLTGQW